MERIGVVAVGVESLIASAGTVPTRVLFLNMLKRAMPDSTSTLASHVRMREVSVFSTFRPKGADGGVLSERVPVVTYSFQF